MNPAQIDQEVRVRLLEKAIVAIENRFNFIDLKFDKIEEKMDSQFHWILGFMITLIITIITLFGGIILHLAKLI